MALRMEDLTHARPAAAAPLGAAVYMFPTEMVRRAAARQRAVERRRHRAQIRRRRVGLALVAVATVIVSIFASGPDGIAPASRAGAPRAVVVQPEETLWDIAERHGSDGVDPRAYVDAISQLNELEGPLMAGVRIRLP